MKLIFFIKKYRFALFIAIVSGALALNLSACITDGKDRIAPRLVKTNLNKSKSLSSGGSLVLVFSKALDKNSIGAAIRLLDSGGTPLEKTKYALAYDNRSKVAISLKDAKLQAQTADYTLEVGQVRDLSGNRLANPKKIKFKFVDDIAPRLLNYKSYYGFKHNSNKPLVFEFSEPIDPSSVIKGTTMTLRYFHKFKNLELNSYQVETKKNQIIVKIVDEKLLKTSTMLTVIFGHFDMRTSKKISDIKDLNGNDLTGLSWLERNKNMTFIESLKPYIVATNLKSNGEFDPNNRLELLFNEKLVSASVNQDSVILKEGTNTLPKSAYRVSYDDDHRLNSKSIFIDFLSDQLKNSSKSYILEFNGVRDTAGADIDEGTGGNPTEEAPLTIKLIDTLAPKFVSSNIFHGHLLADANKIALTFNEPLKDGSEKAVALSQGASPVACTKELSADKKTIFLQPNSSLSFNKNYEISFTSGIEDLSANAFKNKQKLAFQLLDKNKVVFIKADASPSASGNSWQEAQSLKNALATFDISQANNKNIFLLAGGTYKTPDANSAFELKDKMQIFGGFDPNNMNKSRDLNATVIDGNFDAENKQISQQLFTGVNLSATSILDGLVLQNAKNTRLDNRGGAIYLQNSSPKLLNLTFINNVSMGEEKPHLDYRGISTGFIYYDFSNLNGGGALNLDNSSPVIKNSKFIANESYNYGGAIASYENSAPKIDSCYFSENITYGNGGAIYFENSAATIENTIFFKNKFKNQLSKTEKSARVKKLFTKYFFGLGGAISNQRSHTKIKNSSFIDNRTRLFASDDHTIGGGALHNSDSNILLDSVVFKRNESLNGGAIFNLNSNPIIINSSFIANRVRMQHLAQQKKISRGGAIYNFESKPLIVNSTFSNNLAGLGGAIYNGAKSVAKIHNSILWNNGGYSDYKSYIEKLINNNRIQLIYYDIRTSVQNIYNEKSATFELKNSLVNPLSLIENGLYIAADSAQNNLSKDPLLPPIEFSHNFLRPSATAGKKSPAINAGADDLYVKALKKLDESFNETVIPTTEKDQAGNARKQGSNIDMGSIESL